MGYERAKRIGGDQIPVIDIAALRNGKQPLEVARALHRASTDVGFLYVCNHGIEDAALASAREQALSFFRQVPELKDQVRVSGAHRGWLAQGGARMQDGALPDLKESFIWGFEDSQGHTPEDHPLRGTNQWPDSMPHMREAAMNYFSQAHQVAFDLLRGFAIALDLDERFFVKNVAKPLSRASFVYYPPQAPEISDEQFGVGTHTDFGVLTVLAQDEVGGLQVQNIEGDWVEATPIPGTLVVNVGDLLARWTNDVYRSTPHRVLNQSGRERLSLVLAFDPEPDTMIDSSAIWPDQPRKYEPVSCGDYLNWRFAKAFSYRKQ